MPWVKLDDQYPDHPKIVQVGPLGMALHVAATCYCARYLTDGFVPAGMIPRLISLEGLYTIDNNGVSNAVTHNQIIKELQAANLFEVAPGGYIVHDYLKYNPTAAAVKEERAKNAERQADWKEKKRGNADSNGVSNGKIIPPPSPPPLINNNNDDKKIDEIFKAYENNIGPLTGLVGDSIKSALVDYSADWIAEAIGQAVRYEKRSWAYIEAVLKNRKSGGDKKQKSNGSGKAKDYSAGLPETDDPPAEPEPPAEIPAGLTAQDVTAWNTVLGELANSMSKTDYSTWIQPLRPKSYTGGIFTVAAVNKYGAELAKSRINAVAQRVLCGVYGSDITLNFVVN